MAYCSECGKNNVETAKFCGKCGTQLSTAKNKTHLTQQDTRLTAASSTKRLINMFIDIAASVVFMIAIIIILEIFGISTDNMDDNVLGYLGILGYYFTMEVFFHKTIGKMITRTKVVSADGNELTTKQIFIRSISRLVPFEAFSFSGNNPVGWHDRWAKTLVVDSN